MLSYISQSFLMSQLRKVIRRKKAAYFWTLSKSGLDPLPTRFGQPWGDFCLNRFPKTVQLKTTSKQPKNYLKTTSKLPKNYPKTFGIGSTPPLSSVMSKRRLKKTTSKLFDPGFTPRPLFGRCPKVSCFFPDYFPKPCNLYQVLGKPKILVIRSSTSFLNKIEKYQQKQFSS